MGRMSAMMDAGMSAARLGKLATSGGTKGLLRDLIEVPQIWGDFTAH